MSYRYLAAVAIRFFERIPAVVWAVWILGVLVTTAVMALEGGPVG